MTTRIEFRTAELLNALELCAQRDAIPAPVARLQYVSQSAVAIHRLSPDKVSVRVEIQCTVSDHFADIPLPVLDALKVVKSIKRETLTVSVSLNGPILVQTAGVKTKINQGDGELISPQVSPPDFADCQEFSAEQAAEIMAAVGQVAYCVSTDDARPNIAGAYIGDRVCVGTDGHRLAKTTHSTPIEGPGYIVPLDSVRMYQSGATMKLSPNGLVFETPSVLLIGKVIDGKFPNFNQVIPDAGKYNPATIPVAELAELLRAVSPTLYAKTKNAKLELKDSAISLTTVNPDSGETVADSACVYIGPRVVAGFNHEYLRDVCTALRNPGGEMELRINDALSPALFTASGFIGEGAIHIVMPMRL
jgi:DNA polymerase III sliding clamp (beta) subunit (PCNA family)